MAEIIEVQIFQLPNHEILTCALSNFKISNAAIDRAKIFIKKNRETSLKSYGALNKEQQ